MRKVKAMMKASIYLNRACWRKRMIMTSIPTMTTPTGRGKPHKRFSAMAAPMGLSHIGGNHGNFHNDPEHEDDFEGKCFAADLCQISLVATPSLMQRYWRSMAESEETRITTRRSYPNLDPPATSVAQFPGSI
jgi:hypothetical protein